MACNYIYKGKTYTRDEFYKYVEDNLVEKTQVAGYKVIRFPDGQNAAHIEGHETIADEIKRIDDDIKILDLFTNKETQEEALKQSYVEGVKGYYIKGINTTLGYDLNHGDKKAFISIIEQAILDLNKKKQELKSQGIEKLKPIEAFYEIKVGNILEKQFGKDNVKTITDEYGNEWREITIDKQRDLSPIQLQLKSKGQIDPKLDEKLTKFINTLDVQVQTNLDGIKDRNGNKINAVAKADLLNRTIEIAYDKAGKDTLAEETIHFATSMMKDSDTWNKMYEDIINHPKYQEVKDEYGELYKQDEFKIRKEAIDQVITDELIQLYDYQSKEEEIKKLNWAERFIDWLKSIFKNTTPQQYQDEVYNPYKQVASDILDSRFYLFDTSIMRTTEEFYQDRASQKASKVVTQKDIIDNFNKNNLNIDKSDREYFNKNTNEFIKETVDTLVNDSSRKLGYNTNSEIPMLKGVAISLYHGFIADSIINGKKPSYSDANKYVFNSAKTNDSIKKIAAENKISVEQFIIINEEQFNTLVNGVKYVIDDINKTQNELSPDGKVEIRSQQIVYNEVNDYAGTIDIVAAFSDGTLGVYEFTSFKLKENSFGDINGLSDNAKRLLTIKAAAGLKGIIEDSVGITQFRQLRAIPIGVDYGYVKGEGKTLVGFTDLQIATESNPHEYLDHVPLEEEKTGYDKLDNFINSIHKQKENLRANNKLTYSERESKLKELDKIIQVLLFKKDVNLFAKRINYLKESITAKLMDKENPMSDAEILAYMNYLKIFKESNIIYDDLAKLSSKNAKEEYRDLLDNYTGAINNLIDKLNTYAVEKLSTKNGYDMMSPGKFIGLFQSLFGGLQSIDNPMFQAINKLFRYANEKTRKQTNSFKEKLDKDIEGLKSYGRKTGKSLNEVYDLFIEYNSLVNQIDYKRFYKDKEKAYKDGDNGWISKNMKFREADYIQKRDQLFKDIDNPIISPILQDDNLTEEEKRKKIQEYKNDYEFKYNVRAKDGSVNINAILNPNNKFLIPNKKNPDYHTSQYKFIASQPELLNFYNTYSDFVLETRELIGFDKLNESFIPNYATDLIEQIGTKGLTGFFNIGRTFKQSLLVREVDELRGIAANGVDNLQIPIYGLSELYEEPSTKEISNIKSDITNEGFIEGTSSFKNELDRRKKQLGFKKGAELRSKDLGKSLYLFAEQVYNYKNMSDIETEVQMYHYQIKEDKQYTEQETLYGKKLKKWETQVFQKVLGVPGSTKELFEKVIRRELYGQHVQGTRSTFKLGESEYDWAKVYQKFSNYITAKSLGLSPILAASNYIGAKINLFVQFREGIHFDKIKYDLGISKLVNRDPKDTAILGFFETETRDLTKFKADKMSASKLSKIITMDNLLIGHRLGDDNIDKGILLGMARHYVIDSDGKIKNPKTDKIIDSNAKSLYDNIEIKDDKFIINGLKKNTEEEISETEKQLANFRAKVQRIAYMTKGSMGKEQEMLGNTSIMIQAVTKFRKWIPGMATARFSKLGYDNTLEMYNEGRIRAIWGNIIGNGVLPSMKEFMKLTGEITSLGLYTREINQKLLKNKYDKFMLENPETQFTFEEFSDWYIPLLQAKMRGLAFELRALLVMVGILQLTGLAGWDDDEENGIFSMNAHNVLKRSLLELTFFYDKGSVDEIVSSPIVSWGAIGDMQKILTNAIDEAVNPGEDNYPMLYYSIKHVPVFNKIMEIFDFWDKN